MRKNNKFPQGKLNWQEAPPHNIVPIKDRDVMPKEVAIEMLCAPKARLTNRERKTLNDARATVYESTMRPIDGNAKMSVWLQSRSWLQLNNSLNRTREARQQAQHHFTHLQRMAAKCDSRTEEGGIRLALYDRQMKALDVHAAGLDSQMELLENEIDRRSQFCTRLKEVAPTLARTIRRELLGRAS
jgi:hypothetical protein